jgi:hypothetical protein
MRARGAKKELRKEDARRVESAEKWLGLGKPSQALAELQLLTKNAWKHPWSEQVLWRAAQSIEA